MKTKNCGCGNEFKYSKNRKYCDSCRESRNIYTVQRRKQVKKYLIDICELNDVIDSLGGIYRVAELTGKCNRTIQYWINGYRQPHIKVWEMMKGLV